jgi:hypothetical protein
MHGVQIMTALNPAQALREDLGHTPGPWKIYGAHGKYGVHPILDDGVTRNDHHVICEQFFGPDAPFNMILVAKSPELLQMVIRLTAQCATLLELKHGKEIADAELASARELLKAFHWMRLP